MRDILNKVDAYYTGRVEEFGATPRGVDWNSEESQQLRFRQIAAAVPRERPVSVLDFGCGYGAFASFLQRWNPQATYLGYDVSRSMVEIAKSLHHSGQAEFTMDGAALVPVDVVVASGIFNVKLDVSTEEWRDYVFDLLKRIAELSKSGFAFNVLTAYSDPERMRADLYYADPHELFDWCRTHYSPWVAVLHDYGLYEFTIVARKAL